MFCDLTPEALQEFDAIGIMMSHARGAKLFNEGDRPATSSSSALAR